jgi:hypothetical protein
MFLIVFLVLLAQAPMCVAKMSFSLDMPHGLVPDLIVDDVAAPDPPQSQHTDVTLEDVQTITGTKSFGLINTSQLATNAEYSNGTCTTAATIAPANGNIQNVTLTAGDTCALTFTQPSTGTFKLQLTIYQSTSSTYDGMISTSGGGVVEWPGGSTPTITVGTGVTGALATNDIISCYLNGTAAKCVPSQDFQ